MLISLDWIRDYVDLPADLDARELAERLTVTTAEVEGVEAVRIGASGIRVALVEEVEAIPSSRGLTAIAVSLGHGESYRSVTAAEGLSKGDKVLYAPPGAAVAKLGEIRSSTVAGRESHGMVLPADALGIALAAQEAVLIGPEFAPGAEVPPSLFDDWVLEIDNKSLTHRPDLWGHYGIARELAAMYGLALREAPLVSVEALSPDGTSGIPIGIAAPEACRRYTGLVIKGVPTQPAPLWMQLRLGRTGLRPISGLVDLTNYVMTDVGQPMHAFDAAHVDRIEVDFARDGDTFTTLDGQKRSLTGEDLMILSDGKPVALAGVMGGLETEVGPSTTSMLLESANFEPATIRRTAARLGLRTDASARFEKSLDPTNTLIAIQRFVQLAGEMYKELTVTGRLSDAYPGQHAPLHVSVNPHNVSRVIGDEVSRDRAAKILEPLGFGVTADGERWSIEVPTYRATNDISIEADIVEELARFIGYGSIEPAMPRVSMRRFAPNPMHQLQKRTIALLTESHRFNEIFGYLWYDAAWMRQLDVDPGSCVTLRNPAAEGLDKFRRTLVPGMLAAAVRNRFHFPAMALLEAGSVFEPGKPDDHEYRHVGLLVAQRGKKCEEAITAYLKSAVESWAWTLFGRRLHYRRADADPGQPWQHGQQTAALIVADREIGRISVIDTALRRRMDEHLAAWGVAWAEIRLDDLVDLTPDIERLNGIPAFPVVDMDFSVVVPASTTYANVAEQLRAFRHPLLRQARFKDSYEGRSLGDGLRSLTFHVVAGDDERTLAETDTEAFRQAFESHLKGCGYEIRR